jgi:hypothetical protein
MNNKRSRQIVDIVSESRTIKFFITAMFGVVFLVSLPIAIITMPFVCAWHVVDIVFQRKNNVNDLMLFENPNKWGAFEVDFSSWKNHAEGEW